MTAKHDFEVVFFDLPAVPDFKFILRDVTLERYQCSSSPPIGMFKDFTQFLLRGNVVDLAVGVVIGGAFGTVVTALVKDFLTPFIGAIARVPDFSRFVFEIHGASFMVGDFLNTLISFILIACTVFFFVVKPMNMLIARSHTEPHSDPTTKKCPECLAEIPIPAKRCMHCAQVIA